MSAARKGKPAPWKHRESRVVDGVAVYRCGRCAGFFPLDGFYKDKRTTLGIKSECKGCHTATTISSRDPENARALNARYMARSRQTDPDKHRAREREASRSRPVDRKAVARRELNAAIRSGLVVRPAECSGCGGGSRIHGHHDDYTKPLIVRWLCPRCHGREHRKA
jgi:ribosomal protein S27AE